MRLAIVSLAGLALFFWPFLGHGLPPEAPALALAAASAVALLLVELGARQLDARRMALLASLAAIDTALRLALVQGIGGFSPVFFLILCAGWVFGASYGFLVGAFSLLVSGVAEGGVGPWLPYQLFAGGWVGMAAGVAARLFGAGERSWPWGVGVLAAVGLLSGWAYGALMDIQVWIGYYRGSSGLGWVPGMPAATALGHYVRFYLLTSLAYDSFRAVGNLLMVVLLGAPVLAALSRVRARLSFQVVSQ